MTKQQKKSNCISRRTAQVPILGACGLAWLSLSGTTVLAETRSTLPKGLMLNLDFQQAVDGLIPSKSLFPLFVPQNDLTFFRYNGRNVLEFQLGQGLGIPHSSLLDPDGDEWIISIRIFARTDGLILSQGNKNKGFAIYIKDGQIFARVRTAHSSFTLAENGRQGISKLKRRWVTIELSIRKDRALLSLNRKRVAMVLDEPALSGENLRIRLGNHSKLPAVLKNDPTMAPTGFTGAISSLKIHRQ